MRTGAEQSSGGWARLTSRRSDAAAVRGAGAEAYPGAECLLWRAGKAAVPTRPANCTAAGIDEVRSLCLACCCPLLLLAKLQGMLWLLAFLTCADRAIIVGSTWHHTCLLRCLS